MVDGIQTVTNLALLIGPVPNHAERWRWGCMDAIVSGDLAYPSRGGDRQPAPRPLEA